MGFVFSAFHPLFRSADTIFMTNECVSYLGVYMSTYVSAVNVRKGGGGRSYSFSHFKFYRSQQLMNIRAIKTADICPQSNMKMACL